MTPAPARANTAPTPWPRASPTTGSPSPTSGPSWPGTAPRWGCSRHDRDRPTESRGSREHPRVSIGGDEIAGGVVMEEFAVAAPADRGIELLLGVVGPEAALQQVQEEDGPKVAVGAGSQRLADRPHQGLPLPGLAGEDLLAGLDVGGGEFPSHRGQFDVTAGDGDEPEQFGRVHQ